MYPEAIDRLPDTWQSQADGQPRPLLPTKEVSLSRKRGFAQEKGQHPVMGGL